MNCHCKLPQPGPRVLPAARIAHATLVFTHGAHNAYEIPLYHSRSVPTLVGALPRRSSARDGAGKCASWAEAQEHAAMYHVAVESSGALADRAKAAVRRFHS